MSGKGTSGNFYELISAGLGGSVNQLLEVPNRQHMNNKKSGLHEWGNSLHRMPWDNHGALTNTEKLISSTVGEWYAAKHREASVEEIVLINSHIPSACPYCGAEVFIRKGFYTNGIQRYQCKICDQKFSPLTNTIFDSRKIPFSEWIEYLIHLFEFHSITTSARDNRNASSTGKYWLIKVFSVLKDTQAPVMLHGKVYIDEMFFSRYPRDLILKEGKKLKGISRNKICVAVGNDNHGGILIVVENVSKPSNKSTWEAYGSHIKEGSHLIHDDEHSHCILVRKLHLTESVYPSSETKGLKDEENPMDPINNLHALIRRFMREHGGFDRDDLQDWMNLIWFIMSPPRNRYEKVKKFIDMALSSPLKVRYRDVMSKKSAETD